MSNTAEFVRTDVEKWSGDARLYRLSEPLSLDIGNPGAYDFVAVSIAFNPFFGSIETVIFGLDAEGDPQAMSLAYVYRGLSDHTEALSRAGYTVA